MSDYIEHACRICGSGQHYENQCELRKMPRIITEHVNPPIPIRSHDWRAHFDGFEEGPKGSGATEGEAIADLREQCECTHEETDHFICPRCGKDTHHGTNQKWPLQFLADNEDESGALPSDTPPPASESEGPEYPSRLRVAIAEADNFDLWLIIKNGYYYRPNAAGYTQSIADAWKLPKEQAKKYEMYAYRQDVDFCQKVLLEPAPLPDYCNSRDAIVEAILRRFKTRDEKRRFGEALGDTGVAIGSECWSEDVFALATATALQLAVAYARAASLDVKESSNL